MGKEYGLTDMQVSGILAAMSPQKDWFQNVSMAERAIDILSKRGDMAWDANWRHCPTCGRAAATSDSPNHSH
jgi:hypothetical protein